MAVLGVLKHWLRLSLIPWLVLMAFVGIRTWDPDMVRSLRFATFDAYQQLFPRRGDMDYQVYVVDFDDKSLASVAQWPWPRTLIDTLLRKIFMEYQAAAVGFDMVFPEPDRTSPENLKNLWNLDAETRDALAFVPKHDMVFAHGLGQFPVVLGQPFNFHGSIEGEAQSAIQIEPKLEYIFDAPQVLRWLPEAKGVVRNLPGLEAKASGIGHFAFATDVDNVVRRIPMLVRYGQQIYPSLSLELLRVGIGATSIRIMGDVHGLTGLQVGDFYLPTDENGYFWIKYRPYDAGRYLSAVDILDGTAPIDAIAGGLVLMGTSAAGLLDLRSTPIDGIAAGVDAHVQALENILTQNFLYRPQWFSLIEEVLLILFGVFMIYFVSRFGALRSGALALFLVSLNLLACLWAFQAYGFLFDASFPLLTLFSVFMVQNFVRYMDEEASRKAIRSAFGHYLSPALVEILAKSPDKLSLGGEEKEVTVLFSDIRGFTTLSEGMSAEQLTRFINLYLTPMTDLIMNKQGTIDKYMGDAIMAFWNAPLDTPQHARLACEAALEMVALLPKLNDDWRQKGLPEIDIGIGLNTGIASVGNMGSDQRFDYTVLGDTVNLGSRLEGLSKQYGVKIVVSQAVVAQVPEGMFMPLDNVAVKGKTEPVSIYALLGLKADPAAVIYAEDVETARQGIEAYRSKAWEQAKMAWSRLEHFPVLQQLYLERIETFIQSPPPAHWDGVFIATSK